MNCSGRESILGLALKEIIAEKLEQGYRHYSAVNNQPIDSVEEIKSGLLTDSVIVVFPHRSKAMERKEGSYEWRAES